MTGDSSQFEKLIANESEVGCYLAMRTLSYMIWRVNHDAADGRIEDSPDIDESLRVFAEDQTIVAKRIAEITGMAVLTQDGNHVTPAYTQWYTRWSKYIESLPDDTVREIGNKVKSGQDTTDIKLPME